MTEIGSEFEEIAKQNGEGLFFPTGVKDECFTFSGRTAIETVIKNLPQLRRAMLPSYCCDSMIEPFRRAKIDVCFFSVNYDGKLVVEIPDLTDVELLLWTNYFGFDVPMPDLKGFIKRGGIVVEDITHSFFSDKQYHSQSTYLIASLRKWEPILCGGYCASINKKFEYKPSLIPSNEFLTLRKKGMLLKAEYLSDGEEEKKNEYLANFKIANTWLSDNYSGLTIDSYSFDYLKNANYSNNRVQRIKNAHYLYDGLKAHPEIKMLFPEDAMDCPLFVPIIVQKNNQAKLKEWLINNSIYCPIHWPHPNAKCESNLYYNELSLVCDQRYNEKDMQRIIGVLCQRE